MRSYLDVCYTAEADEVRVLDAYLPDGKPDSIFLYIHGGGLDHGSRKRAAEDIGKYLTDRGVAYVTIDYRLYPNAEYPDYILDAANAIRFVKDNSEAMFDGCDKLFVGGSSAGGYISMMLCFDKRYLASVGLDNSAISGYFHDAGQPTAHFKVLSERGFDPRRIIVDETCPMYHVGTAPSYPPMRFIVSDNDMQNRYEQTMLMLSTMKHFGYTAYDHRVMHGRHCHYCAAIDEDGNSTFGKMVYDFITAENIITE